VSQPLFTEAELIAGGLSLIPIWRGSGNYWQWLSGGNVRVAINSVIEATFSAPTWSRLQSLTWTVDMPGGTATLEGATTGDTTKALASGASAGPFGAGNDLILGSNAVGPTDWSGIIHLPRKA